MPLIPEAASVRIGPAEIEDCLFQRIRDHGYAGSDAELHALLDFDVAINVQGLEVWLDRMQG